MVSYSPRSLTPDAPLHRGLDVCDRDRPNPEISIVIPCLNEADTLGKCIVDAKSVLVRANISGEIVIADNGSSDGSAAIAMAAGAVVVNVAARGYGSALRGGISAARGKFILIVDGDDSYDLEAVPEFVALLRQGYDLVQGCRLPRGGGCIEPGAMPLSHRWLGNPLFSTIVRWCFNSPVHDVYCGMRAFTGTLIPRLNLMCDGMEFAAEMIIRASQVGARSAEVAITLRKDGRKAHRSHLRTFRDGMRTVRLFVELGCARRHLFNGGPFGVNNEPKT